MQTALTSGEWYVDNNQITEQLGLAQRVNEASSHNGPSASSRTNMQPMDTNSADSSATSNSRNPKLVPIKSFQNELLNLSVSQFCTVLIMVLSIVFNDFNVLAGLCARLPRPVATIRARNTALLA